MRIMAVDYGDAHTGVAVSDPTGLLAGHTTTIHSRSTEKVLESLEGIAAEYGVERIVLGLPKNMDGTEGARAELCRAFGAQLESRVSLPVVMWDERRTTVDAHRLLHTAGKKSKAHKRVVDAVAASLILEGYLASLRRA